MIDSITFVKEEELSDLIDVIKGKPLKRGPYHLEIEITDRCNANCYFCNQRELNIRQKEMSFSDFKDILLDLSKRGLRAIRLSGGGEPTVHTDILRILEFISHSQLRINFFNTNGILLTPEVSEKLIQCKTEILQISLNSSDPKTWAKINGCREADFYKVLDNIRKFKRYDKYRTVHIIGSFIIDELTYRELPVMERLCRELNIELQVKDLNCYTYSHYFRTICLPVFLKDLVNLIKAKNINNFLFLNIPKLYVLGKTIRDLFAQRADSFPCFAPWVSALIRANGDAYPCCALPSGNHICGNIFKQRFMDIWLDSGFKRLRSEYKTAIFENPRKISEFKSKHFFRFFAMQNFLTCPIRSMFYNPNFKKCSIKK